MNLKNKCSLKDTTVLRDLILENPELPLIVFCGEDAWNGDYGYTQGASSKGEIETLTLYDGCWLYEEDYREKLSDKLCEEEEYRNLSDEEFDKMLDEKVENTDFVKAIVLLIG